MPIDNKQAAERLGDKHKLSKKEVTDFLAQSEEIGFVDAEDIEPGRKLYFNGNLFRRESAKKIEAVTSSLTSEDTRKVLEMEELLSKRGCVTLQESERVLGQTLFKKLQSISMYDVNEVSNDQESLLYVTHPAAFEKYGNPFADDVLDLAKALVACLTYGMTRSSSTRGRIRLLPLLMKKLIRGEWVGPAPAIGEDYRVLELKRVVEIKKDGSSFSMRLLKKDIGQMAIKVMTEGDASDITVQNLVGAPVTKYTRPEDNRVITLGFKLLTQRGD